MTSTSERLAARLVSTRSQEVRQREGHPGELHAVGEVGREPVLGAVVRLDRGGHGLAVGVGPTSGRAVTRSRAAADPLARNAASSTTNGPYAAAVVAPSP